MADVAIPGTPFDLFFQMYDESNGTLADPDSLQLDITYGDTVGFQPDVESGGPFFYSGVTSGMGANILRTGTGLYQFSWVPPSNAPAGAYTANWTYGFESDTYLVTENFYVAGSQTSGGGIPVPAGDIGFWTGGLIYPAAGLDIEFGTVDANGICWLWNKITGWDGPDVQGGGVIPRSGDHGAWASPQYYAARQITLTVTATAPTQALRDQARAILQQAVPVSDLCELRYDEPVPKMAMVRRSGKIPESYPTVADVKFTIGLVAPDPRKYSASISLVSVNAAPPVPVTGFTFPLTLPLTPPAQQPGGSIAVTNNGNFETRPTMTVFGPITSPAVTNVTTGQTVSWTGLVVPVGQSLVIDTLNMQAALGGGYRAADPFSSWWNLPPGTSTIALAGQSDAGAYLQIQWRDAYI